jgi:hypothetical protein
LITGFVGPIIQECFSKNIGQVDHIVSGPRGDEPQSRQSAKVSPVVGIGTPPPL